MEAQQATFTTFNEAAERVAENLDENSPGVDAIQDKMEEFNDHWNKVTTQLSDRLTLVSIDSNFSDSEHCMFRSSAQIFSSY